MAPSNTKTPVLYALGGMVITGITIDIGLGGLVLLYISASYAIEYSFSALTEPLIATAISLPMIGLAILGLFFGVWLLVRGATTNWELLLYIVLSILFSIVALLLLYSFIMFIIVILAIILLLIWIILLLIYGMPGL